MTKATNVQTGDWVVVCDGRKALILENAGDARFPNLRMREVFDHPSEPTRNMGTDQPGRSHQSMGNRRSAVHQTDFHDEAERSFLNTVAMRLKEALDNGRTKAIVLVAPPRALGMIRSDWSQTLQRAVTREIGKDAVKLPIQDIEAMVFGPDRP